MPMLTNTIHMTSYYVYALVDPRDGAIFYVGKGQRRRAWQHEMDVRVGKNLSNQAKCDRIRDILAADLRVTVRIIENSADEAEALNREAQLISTLPGLTNIKPRGHLQNYESSAVRSARQINALLQILMAKWVVENRADQRPTYLKDIIVGIIVDLLEVFDILPPPPCPS